MSKWVVTFREGYNPTYTIVDELPVVFPVTDEQLEEIDESGIPEDCFDLDKKYGTHIHLDELINDSIWNDQFEELQTKYNELVEAYNDLRVRADAVIKSLQKR